MTITLSVITCSYNPRFEYLQRVIEALKQQTLDPDQWEYLLIDNASNEPLSQKFDLAWHPNSRHVLERKPGLTNARLRGIQEAEAELLIFVDDDNVLDPDFLEKALAIANASPHLGAWSGQTRPEFESPPPDWTRRYWGNLVIRPLAEDCWSNLPHLPATMPCGAGLCVRQNVAEHYLFLHTSGKRRFMLDRVGQSLASAGDNDLAACACDVGLGVGVFQALKLIHLMPAERLEESYLLRLVEGIAYSSVVFRSFRDAAAGQERSRLRRIADLIRMLFMDSRERRFFRASKRGERQAVRDLDSGSTGQYHSAVARG
jgi:glycosyltransferase involved in cell wall biosynthesis